MLFGKEFELSVVDKSLTEALRQYRKVLGDDVVIDEPVKHISEKRGIVDLMLSRILRRHRADEVDHLVGRPQTPKVKVIPTRSRRSSITPYP